MTNTVNAAASGDWLLGGDLPIRRMGYGAMQLAGPGVFGPPRDPDAAVAVLRRAVELGVNHIDTSDFYGPYVVNELINKALRPYPDDLVLVTKVGAVRDEQGGWIPATRPEQLRKAVHENLDHLGVDVLDLVNLRLGGQEGPVEGSLAEQFGELAGLREQGLIRHLGCRSSRSAARSNRWTPRPSPRSRPGTTPPRRRSRWPGCWPARRPSCSSRAPPRSGTSNRTWRPASSG